MKKRSRVELLQDLLEEDIWELDLLVDFDYLEDLPEFLDILYDCVKRRAIILNGLGVRKHVDG